jgi:hypothetical protein
MEWIRLTPQHLSDLAGLRNRLHLNPRILIRHARDCPGNLNENKIYDILGGRYKQIRKTHFDFLMGLLSGLKAPHQFDVATLNRTHSLK